MDVTYAEYLTGAETTHIPSWCGDDPDFMAHRIRYEPRRPEIVLTPYRLNLEYSREDIPETGWRVIAVQEIAQKSAEAQTL